MNFWCTVAVSLILSTAAAAERVVESRGRSSDTLPLQVAVDNLRKAIERAQKSSVQESYGELDFECFTHRDLQGLVGRGEPKRIAQEVSQSPEFKQAVGLLRAVDREERKRLLSACRRPLRSTWAEQGRISRQGQTVAGQQAERLIAEAVVDLVEELLSERK